MFWRDLAFPYKEEIKTHLKHSTYSWNCRRWARNTGCREFPPPKASMRGEWKQLSLKLEDFVSASMCSQLRVGSTLNAQLGYTHLKDYINTQGKKRKAVVHVHVAFWLAKGLHFEHVPENQRVWREAQGDGERVSEMMGRRNTDRVMLTGSCPPQREESDVQCLPPTSLLLQSWRPSSSYKHHLKAGAHFQDNLICAVAQSIQIDHGCYTFLTQKHGMFITHYIISKEIIDLEELLHSPAMIYTI